MKYNFYSSSFPANTTTISPFTVFTEKCAINSSTVPLAFSSNSLDNSLDTETCLVGDKYSLNYSNNFTNRKGDS